MESTEVFIRESNKFQTIQCSFKHAPEIQEEMLKKWQELIDLTSDILEVPAALIMRIHPNEMETFLSSNSLNNPYKKGENEPLGKGLYCETVIGKNKELLIKNALKDKIWKNNPDIKLGMISYFGFPIKWPNNVFFGTICVLDTEERDYNQKQHKLLKQFKNMIEKDLALLVKNEELNHLASHDSLTKAYNRHQMVKILDNLFNEYKRTGHPFCIVILDLNKFKMINDHYGHKIGDQLLKSLSKSFRERIRKTDFFCRFGGDEFLLICPNSQQDKISEFIENIYPGIEKEMQKIAEEASFSYGIAEIAQQDDSFDSLIIRADNKLYKMKQKIKKESASEQPLP